MGVTKTPDCNFRNEILINMPKNLAGVSKNSLYLVRSRGKNFQDTFGAAKIIQHQ